jgi:hypothetical protein
MDGTICCVVALTNQKRRILHAPLSATRDTSTSDNQCPRNMPIVSLTPLLESASLTGAGQRLGSSPEYRRTTLYNLTRLYY